MSIIDMFKRLISGASAEPSEQIQSSKTVRNEYTFSEGDKLVAQKCAEDALRVFTESLNIANQSKIRVKRESTLQIARDTLIELKNLSNKFPFLHLENLPAVEASMAEVEAETRALPYLSARDEQAILMSIQSYFRVINESIKIARKSKNLETKLSRLRVARNNLKEAQKQASQFSLEIEGFDKAEAEINRLDEAIKTGMPTEIPGMQKIDVNTAFSSAARNILIEATALKKEKKYIEACDKLREAYSADGAENLVIEERLRLPMYLLLAGRNDEGWDELNRLNARYVDQISQPTIANQMRVFLKKEGKNRAAAPGIMNINRENTRALVYTHIQTVANAARLEAFRKNPEAIECLVWLGTLDASTCLICAARDLKQYTLVDNPPKPIGHSLPWKEGPGAIHWGCRCATTIKAKSFRDIGVDIDEPGVGTRASDEGQVPADTDFESFLEQQGSAWQDRVLGPSRAALWRDKTRTLEQLAADYLLLLTAIRKIVELNESIENRIDKLRQMLSACDWQDFLSEHGGIEEIVQYFFPRFIKSIPTLTTGAVDELSRLGLDTPNRIAAAPDETLLSIKGIGQEKLKVIRDYCAGITDNRDADRVENVIR